VYKIIKCLIGRSLLYFVFLQQNLQQIEKELLWKMYNGKLKGMDCSSCALTIHKYLEKQGMKNVKVNSVSGDVSFEMNGSAATPKTYKGLSDLGYQVATSKQATEKKKPFFQHIFIAFSFVFHLHLCLCCT
jgi:cation transport ATPase